MKLFTRFFTAVLLLVTLSPLLSAAGTQMKPHGHDMRSALRHDHAMHGGTPPSLRSVTSLLVADADYTYTGTKYYLSDTGTYVYSQGRGYDQTDQSWNWDTFTARKYDTITTAYTNSYRYLEHFDANSNDTLYLGQVWDTTAGGSWVNSNLDHQYVNSSGYSDSALYQEWSSTWVNDELSYFTYNSNHKMISWQIKDWNTGTMAWDISSLYTYQYDGSGDQVSEVDYDWDAALSQWDSSYQYLYIYDGQHDQLSETDLSPGTTGWDTGSVYHYSGFVATQALELLSLQWVAPAKYDTGERFLYTYNADDFTLTYSNQGYHGNPSWPLTAGDRMGTYTYTADAGSGIASVAAAGDLYIYPVPASAVLSLQLTWTEAQTSTAMIYDATGRKCGEYPLPNTISYHGPVAVGSLADGLYTIVIKGEKGSVMKKFTVLR